MTAAETWETVRSFSEWYHCIEVAPGIVTPGINNGGETLRHLAIPADLRGKRVLDLGARDGYFSFEMARRGAEVLAIDYFPKERTGFAIAAKLLNMDVPYRQENIYDLSPEELGQFDLILFLGLLYHLPDPLLALEKVRLLCRDLLCVETYAIDNHVVLKDGTAARLADVAPQLSGVPIMQFYPCGSLNNDGTNFWGPNVACIKAMLAQSNFVVDSSTLLGDRAILNCRLTQGGAAEYFNAIARGLPP
jgi:tRNA (mo5U34)-methyltransferase